MNSITDRKFLIPCYAKRYGYLHSTLLVMSRERYVIYCQEWTTLGAVQCLEKFLDWLNTLCLLHILIYNVITRFEHRSEGLCC